MPSQLLTTAEAADLLRKSQQTLRNWRSTREVQIPYVKIGKAVRYKLADLEKWIEKNTVGAK